jgi:hypothetical protein
MDAGYILIMSVFEAQESKPAKIFGVRAALSVQ